MGRRFGKPFLHRRPHWVLAARQALALAERYDALFILTFRFMYGIRNISGFALGLSKITSVRFLVFNFIAAGIWAVIFSGGGYLFGHVSQAVLGKWAEVVGLSLLGCFIATSWTAILIQRRHMKRAALKFNLDDVTDPVRTGNRRRETIGKK
jgi:membrane protein DedA with SNARE-associated domain